MNIFITDYDPVVAAQNLCDKHIVSQIKESAQMLSTAHRVLDGKGEVVSQQVKGSDPPKFRKATLYTHPNPYKDRLLYAATHVNHPSNRWIRSTSGNYYWLLRHFKAMCEEYTYRYDKIHACDLLLTNELTILPKNIHRALFSLTDPSPLVVSDEVMQVIAESNDPDPIAAYRLFYQEKQDRFNMVWTKRDPPSWFAFKENA